LKAGSDEIFSPEELTELAEQMHKMWHAILRGVVHPQGHPEPAQARHYWVLGSLVDGPRRMSDLAECAQTSQASLTGIVDRMEEHGLVERVRSRDDRRVVEVTLTPAGDEEMRRVKTAILGSLDVVLSPLTTQERRQLLSLIRTIAVQQPSDPDRTS
jgi:DNA-binding MarR family transcriptional regulator